MGRLRLRTAVVCCLAVMGTAAMAEDQESVTFSEPVPAELSYWQYLPENYDEQDKWPLMIFLHGSGERGDDLEIVKKHGPPKLISEGKSFPCIVVSPQCGDFHRWEVTVLNGWLDHLLKTLKVDPDRVYLTGLSMGGYGTWEWASRYPDRFAAIAPICGSGDEDAAERIAGIPTWVIHGVRDEAVPFRSSAVMVGALQAAGANPKFTIYPDGKHDVWTETYEKDEFYDWLFAQKRGE